MSRPLRIAMVAACPYPWPRGTPIRIHRMALALARRGHEVHVATYHLGQPTDGLPFTVHRIRDVPGYRRTEPGPTARKLLQLDPMLVRLLRGLHRDLAFDVVHAHHYEGVLVASRARGGVPIVYDAHTTLGGELPQYRIGLPAWAKYRIGRRLDRRIPALASRTIAVSTSIRDTLIALGAVRADRVDVLPNGIDPDLFREGPGGASGGDPVVIFTGNLAAYQRVDLLLRSFAALRGRRPGVRLSIVTDGPFTAYERLAGRLGVRAYVDVRIVPFEQQPALLAAAAVAVNPRTQCDGMPQKLLNYMAAGLPVVSFDGSAAHLEHERTGLRVPDGDTSAMADAIERLLDDPALGRRLGEAARDEVRRNFSWDRVALRVEEVYGRVIGGESPSSSSIGAP